MSAYQFTTAPAIVQPEPLGPEWTDDAPWPAEPPGPRTLAEVLEDEARAYDAWGTEAGRLLAWNCRRLATELQYTGARTLADHLARLDVLERWEHENGSPI